MSTCSCFSSRDVLRMLVFGVCYSLLVAHFVVCLLAGVESRAYGGHNRFSQPGMPVTPAFVQAHAAQESGGCDKFLRILGDLISGDKDWEAREFAAFAGTGAAALLAGALILASMLLAVALRWGRGTSEAKDAGTSALMSNTAAEIFHSSRLFIALNNAYVLSCLVWAIATVIIIESKFRKGNGYFNLNHPDLHLFGPSRVANQLFWMVVGLIPLVGTGAGFWFMYDAGILCFSRGGREEQGDIDGEAHILGSDEITKDTVTIDGADAPDDDSVEKNGEGDGDVEEDAQDEVGILAEECFFRWKEGVHGVRSTESKSDMDIIGTCFAGVEENAKEEVEFLARECFLRWREDVHGVCSTE